MSSSATTLPPSSTHSPSSASPSWATPKAAASRCSWRCDTRTASKLVTLSATYRQDGWYPEVLQGLSEMTADVFVDTPIGEAFRGHTPDPDAFDAYVAKMRVLNFADQQISDEAMRGIHAATMIIIGDADGVRPEHAVEMFKLRGGGDPVAAATGEIAAVPPARLVILPATSHISIGHADAVLAPMISDFLDDVPPPNPTLF